MKNTFFTLITLLTLASCDDKDKIRVQIIETGQKVKVEIESSLYDVGDTIIIANSRGGNWYIKAEFDAFEGASKDTCGGLANSTLYCWTDYKAIILL